MIDFKYNSVTKLLEEVNDFDPFEFPNAYEKKEITKAKFNVTGEGWSPNKIYREGEDFIARFVPLNHTSPWPKIFAAELIEGIKIKSNFSQERMFCQSEIEKLQSDVHKITGDGDVMKLFNILLGVNSG